MPNDTGMWEHEQKNMTEGVAKKNHLKIDQYVRLYVGDGNVVIVVVVVVDIVAIAVSSLMITQYFCCTVIKYIVVDIHEHAHTESQTRRIIELHSCVSSNGNQNQKCFCFKMCPMRKSNGNNNERHTKNIVLTMAHWLLLSPLFDRRDESQQMWKTIHSLHRETPVLFYTRFYFQYILLLLLYPGNFRMEKYECARVTKYVYRAAFA